MMEKKILIGYTRNSVASKRFIEKARKIINYCSMTFLSHNTHDENSVIICYYDIHVFFISQYNKLPLLNDLRKRGGGNGLAKTLSFPFSALLVLIFGTSSSS